MKTHDTNKMRVLIVGGGATGMSAAYAFSRHPDQFVVTLYERSSSPGGMATSNLIDKDMYGADYINDGVQGASPVFHNTYAMFERLGFSASKVEMQVSFGRDPKTDFWTNVFPSPIIDEFKDDIKKFGRVLRIIKTLEPLFAMISVSAMLRIFRFSKGFGEIIVFPLVALFFGTGNQTPFVSCAILERVFMDPNMRLFDYSPNSFLASIPTMCAFPCLSELYNAWKALVEEESRGSVRIINEREVTRVLRSFSKDREDISNVQVWSRNTRGTDNTQSLVDPGEESQETFDEIIFCTDAEETLKILGTDARWLEKRVLGNVKYLWDVTVTHNDLEYMKKYYRMQYELGLRSTADLESIEIQKKFEFAEKQFTPLYFIRSYPSDKRRVEMSFDLTAYQPQFKGVPTSGLHSSCNPSQSASSSQGSSGENMTSGALPPLEKHVFQTIFLDNSPESSNLWTKEEISPDKIIMTKWWKQQSHRWQHYAGTVPWMGLINGRNHTHFAGAWTILNMHEIAVASGFAAAYRLGASFPFKEDEKCKRLFALCLGANHMARLRKEDRNGFFI